MKKIILNIEGMTCSACSNGLEKYLKKQEGIIDASVNLVMATALIECEDYLSVKELNTFVQEAGFKSLGEQKDNKRNRNTLKLIIIFSFLSLILMYISMGSMLKLKIPDLLNKNIYPKIYVTFSIIISTMFLIWGSDILKNGIKNIIRKMPNMDSLVGIGVIVNFTYSLFNALLVYRNEINAINNLYFESSAMIILFVKIGRYIDKKNKAKAVDAIKNLVTITPKNAIIFKEEKEITVTINEIQKGDIVVCRPGEKIAVDGIITKGTTHTDESFLTGESKPVRKVEGSTVMAGSINHEGYIEYRAEKIGKDSSISNIVDLVFEATNTKAPISRIADTISGYFVPIIFIIAIISFLLNIIITKNIASSILALVSVLVVACPCALGLATPLAMVVSIGNASKKGILVKSSESIEAINKIDTVVFDKTGTITKGELSIVDGEYSDENLKLLQSLEAKSNHPIAKSIYKNAKKLLNVDEFEEISGKGIKGKIEGKTYFAGNRKFLEDYKIINRFENLEKQFAENGETIVYFWSENELLAILGLADSIKPEIKNTIKNLKNISKKVVILTGDNAITANAIAKEIGVEAVYSNISPSGKLKIIQELNKNKNCIMVGDGINDSPALKTACIGISVAGGTDISADSADIVLMKKDMNLVYDLFILGKRTIKIIKQNLFWALFYNICMIPLATGLLPIRLNPMIASLSMTISSLTVVLNSLRLRNFGS